MIDKLVGLGYGIIVLAIVIGVGSLVLYNFGGTVGCTTAAYTSWNKTSNLCYEPSNGSNTTAPAGVSYTNTNYLLGQLGTTGLSGWVPTFIAVFIGLLFLGAFMVGKGSKGSVGRY
jgi:hypothetical protein